MFDAATAKRIRNDTKTTLRRRTSTRSRGTTTSRRMSTTIHDAAVSMLPDLSENLSNEERTWEEIMQIKAMPVCMSQKIQLKNQLQVCRKVCLSVIKLIRLVIIYPCISERDETKTPGLRAAEVAAQKSLAAISHQDERSLLQDGAVE